MTPEQPDKTESGLTKITNPERVYRILERLCASGMPVIIRVPTAQNTAIRGRASNIDMVLKPPQFRVHAISEQGQRILNSVRKAKIEFLGLTTQVAFETEVLARENGIVGFALPDFLTSLERRENVRYPCTPEKTCFIQLSTWRPEIGDNCAPPVIPQYEQLGSWLNVADISLGGICIMSRFPAIVRDVKRGFIDQQARLILPMHPPLTVGLEVRWVKKIKERIKVEGSQRFERIFKIGIQLSNPNEQVVVGIKQFMRHLSMAEAV